MLSDVTYDSISGTSVARDFVELPSQLYQHWLGVPEVLEKHARHHETGAAMPRDLVDRIPLGETGDAVGNIAQARRWQLSAVLTLLGAPLGLPGAQLDLRGTWQRSSVIDPIEGFERDIGRLRTRDVRAEFRHDILPGNWSYGFVLQTLALAPVYQSNLVQFQDIPSGGLTPGQNTVFVEHKDVLGLRVRASVSEFVGQKSRFSRVIHGARRDLAPVDRIERRARALGGPFLSLSIAGAF